MLDVPTRAFRVLEPGRALVLVAALASVLVAAAVFTASAGAATVLVLGPGGHVSVQNDRFLTTPAVTPAPAATGRAVRTKFGSRQRSIGGGLHRLEQTHQVASTAYKRYSSILSRTQNALRRLSGTRATELGAVLGNLQAMTDAGDLTAGRLPVLFQTLQRNLQWWTTGPLLAADQRVEFKGSQLVWEYYPGQGIELQVLGTFGEADGLYTAGRADYGQFRQLMSEMIPLGTRRGGGLTWEYYFYFDGGVPPWTSAMSQGTGIEALTRAYEAFDSRSYLNLAHRALKIFTIAPPVGVRDTTGLGAWYVQYTFAPGAGILNAFLQSLIGLYDYGHASNDQEALRLFRAGNSQAQAVTPQYNTGGWSLYQPGVADTLSYHQLVTGFLQELCSRTGATAYCQTASDFQRDLTAPPSLALLTTAARHGLPITLSYRVSEPSHVGIVVTRNGNTVFSTSADFGYGVQSFALPSLARGTYSVRLAATDVAGKFNRITGTLKLS